MNSNVLSKCYMLIDRVLFALQDTVFVFTLLQFLAGFLMFYNKMSSR